MEVHLGPQRRGGGEGTEVTSISVRTQARGSGRGRDTEWEGAGRREVTGSLAPRGRVEVPRHLFCRGKHTSRSFPQVTSEGPETGAGELGVHWGEEDKTRSQFPAWPCLAGRQ